MAVDKGISSSENTQKKVSAAVSIAIPKPNSPLTQHQSTKPIIHKDCHAKSVGAVGITDRKISKCMESLSLEENSKFTLVMSSNSKTKGRDGSNWKPLTEAFRELSLKSDSSTLQLKKEKITNEEKDNLSEDGGEILGRGPMTQPRWISHTNTGPYGRQAGKLLGTQSRSKHLSGGRLISPSLELENGFLNASDDSLYQNNFLHMGGGSLQDYLDNGFNSSVLLMDRMNYVTDKQNICGNMTHIDGTGILFDADTQKLEDVQNNAGSLSSFKQHIPRLMQEQTLNSCSLESHSMNIYNLPSPGSDSMYSHSSSSSPLGAVHSLPQGTDAFRIKDENKNYQQNVSSYKFMTPLQQNEGNQLSVQNILNVSSPQMKSQSSQIESQFTKSLPGTVQQISMPRASSAQVVPNGNNCLNYQHNHESMSSSPSDFSVDSPMSMGSSSSCGLPSPVSEQFENLTPYIGMSLEEANLETQKSEKINKKYIEIQHIINYLMDSDCTQVKDTISAVKLNQAQFDELQNDCQFLQENDDKTHRPANTAVPTTPSRPNPAQVPHESSGLGSAATSATFVPLQGTSVNSVISCHPISNIQNNNMPSFFHIDTSNQVTQEVANVPMERHGTGTFQTVNPHTVTDSRSVFNNTGTNFPQQVLVVVTQPAISAISTRQQQTNTCANTQIICIPGQLPPNTVNTATVPSLMKEQVITPPSNAGRRSNVRIQPKISPDKPKVLCQSSDTWFSPHDNCTVPEFFIPPRKTTTWILLERTQPKARIEALNRFTKCNLDDLVTPDEDREIPLHILVSRDEGKQGKPGFDTGVNLASLWALVKTMKDSNKHAELNAKNIQGYTPLYLSCILKKPIVAGFLAETLQEVHTDLNEEFCNGNRLLHFISHRGDSYIEILETLLNVKNQKGEPVFDVNLINDNGETPLHVAVKSHGRDKKQLGCESNSCINTVKLLLHHSASPVIKEGRSGRTPVYLAIQETNDPKLISELLDNCSQVDKILNEFPTYSGDTALHRAASRNNLGINEHKRIIEILLDKGAHTDIKDRQGRLPINLVEPEKEEVKKLLRKRR